MSRIQVYLTFAMISTIGHLLWARSQPSNWSTDLNSHFLPQQLVLIALCFVALLFTVKRVLSFLFIGLCVAASVYLTIPNMGPSATINDANAFQVISYNLNASNQNYGEVTKWVLDNVKDGEPTIALFIEVSEPWGQALENLKAKLPYSALQATKDNFGMAVYSNQPLDQVKIEPLLPSDSEWPTAAANGIWKVAGRELRFIGIHPPPPIREDMFDSRNDTFKKVDEIVAASSYAIVAGDFNCTPWSKNFDLLFATSGLKDSDAGLARKHTWGVLGGIFSLPIDFVLQKGSIIQVSSEIGPAMGSDHRPVKKRFAITN